MHFDSHIKFSSYRYATPGDVQRRRRNNFAHNNKKQKNSARKLATAFVSSFNYSLSLPLSLSLSRCIHHSRTEEQSASYTFRRRRTPRWTETRRSAGVSSSSPRPWRPGNDAGDAASWVQVVGVVEVDASYRHRRPRHHCRMCRRPPRCSATARALCPPALAAADGTPGLTRSATRAARAATGPAGAVRTGKRYASVSVLGKKGVYI